MTKPKYTPMMMQYLHIKEKHPDTLILFRLGDFYELFFDDARIVSKECELVLTGKDAGAEERVPMCGMPYHAVNNYIEKLIKRGYKIGIVEQLEDPALAKGLVKRDVIQIVTPGTMMDVGLDAKNQNYIAALDDYGTFFALAYADISTGHLFVTTLDHDQDILEDELSLLEIKELIVNRELIARPSIVSFAKGKFILSQQEEAEPTLEYEPLFTDINDSRLMVVMVRLLNYLTRTQRRNLDYWQVRRVEINNTYIRMDLYTRLNLELTRTIRSEDRFGSLLWVIDHTETAMGARALKSSLLRPFSTLAPIMARHAHIGFLINELIVMHELSKELKQVYDLERLIARIGYGNANARDLVQLSTTLKVIPRLKSMFIPYSTSSLYQLINSMGSFDDYTNKLDSALVDNPPFTTKEGGMIKEGFDAELDQLRVISRGGKEWITAFESAERERTGIKNLKVGFNRVFGFYIEVSKGSMHLVKPEFGYDRKQTLTTGERFTTPELKEKESQVLHAEEQSMKLEYSLFIQLRDEIKTSIADIQKTASVLAEIDVVNSLAKVALDNRWVAPQFNDNHQLNIVAGRHPVLERVVGSSNYIPNDVKLSNEKPVMLITGPNMGGKSTYMRQLALLVVLAQIGSFIPVESATMPLYDQIFTRIGASDDLVSGQSTFMVEMMEANHALREATTNSLILFDEIGRGTSTYDGMALAQSLIEHLVMHVRAHTMFSTHYHELTNLEMNLKGLFNVHVGVHEQENEITFLYKIQPGPANKSYGINVARLAHLPDSLLQRAEHILNQLETRKVSTSNVAYEVIKKIDDPDWLKELKTLDPLSLSPMAALNYLYELKKRMK